MPSLSALEKFKASFNDIGGEKADLRARNIPFDDLQLPNSEPKPIIPSAEPEHIDADSGDASPIDDEEIDEEIDDLDFSAFTSAPVEDLSVPPIGDIDTSGGDQEEPSAGNEEPPPAPPPAETSEAADDFYSPAELLDNLAEELDAIPEESSAAFEPVADSPPAADSSPEPSAQDSESSLDLDSLDNFDFPEDLGALDSPAEPAEPEPSVDEPPATEDSGESAGAGDTGSDFSMDDLGDLDFPTGPAETAEPDEPSVGEPSATEDSGESSEAGDLGGTDDTGGDFSMDDLGDLDFPDGPAEPDEPPATEDSGESAESGDLGGTDDSGGDFSMDDLGDLDFPDGPAEPDEPPATEDSGESAGSGDLGGTDDSGSEFSVDDLGDLGDLDSPSEPDEPSVDEPPATEDSGESSGLDDSNNFDILDESASEGGGIDFGNENDLVSPDDLIPMKKDESESDSDSESFDSSDTVDDSDTSGTTDEASDFDDMLPPAESTGEGSPDSESGAESDTDHVDDFSFPELDDILKDAPKKASVDTAPAAPQSKGKIWGKGKAGQRARTEPLPDDVEEIQLSDDELQGVEETLSRYPLNLRIACEEIIAEHVVNPKQMSELIEHLVWGASAKETAVLAGRILGKTISIPKAFQKSTGEALEAEQASFAYIFVHNFLPILRLFAFIAIVAASIFYLSYKFAYIPHKAETLYQMGYERIFAGEYQRANERFSEAFAIHRNKNWFYKYAEAFRDERQYLYAEQKYDELLGYYLRDKKGILDYANLETYYLRNYAKADTLLRHQLLDYAPNDYEGLLAAGDNYLAWGEVDPAKYEDARFSYARLLEQYGWKPPIVERMMKYFIRTDNLKEVLPLKEWFDYNPKGELSAETLGELGGYLLDKKLEEVQGVPNEYVEHIDGVRDLLLKAVYADPTLPEPHYHLARYYHSLGLVHEERRSLQVAVRTFEAAREESVRRLNYRIDAYRRYADVLINDREFMPAEEQLLKGINLYEDAVSRRLIARSPQYGKLYAGLGDLEYFTKIDDMETSLYYYHRAEQNGWAPPEMQYRMGAAYYHLENWKNALEYLAAASSKLPLSRRILFAMGNTALKRGDYFVAMGYYNRLLDILERQRARLPVLLPNDGPEYLELAERLMQARNNAGVACEMLAAQTGNRTYSSRAMAFYAEADRAWDSLTRDPRSMIRSNSIPLPYLNSRNTLYPQTDYEPQIFIRIDREALENSPWEELSPLLRMETGDNRVR